MSESLLKTSRKAKNPSPCARCKRLHRKCDGEYPCDGCLRSRDRLCAGHCRPSTRLPQFGLEDGASAHGLNTSLKFIMEDPSSATLQRLPRGVTPDNSNAGTQVNGDVNSRPETQSPPVMNDGDRSAANEQVSTSSATEEENWPAFMEFDDVLGTTPQTGEYSSGNWETEFLEF